MWRNTLFTVTFVVQGAISNAAPTVNISVAPTSCAGSCTPAVTWTSNPAAVSCVASGGWTGAKAASGTQVLPAITVTTSYALTCTDTTGAATITWLAPTQNTDGSPLTNLAGYRIYHGQGAAPLTLIVDVPAPALTATFKDLPLGPHTFAATAYNTAAVESAKSPTAAITLIATTGSANAAVTVTPVIPNPPGAPVVTQTTAFYASQAPNAYVMTSIGTVPLGTPCIKEQTLNGLLAVDRAKVTYKYSWWQPLVVLAKCM